MLKEPLVRTARDYDIAFELGQQPSFPLVDALEQRTGYALETAKLEGAARVLACPVKANPPCWAHGRVLYSVVRQYLEGCRSRVLMLDIGTAKGFSALCLQWALNDAQVQGTVVSVDVIDPRSREARNTVAELDGGKTLSEVLAPWPEGSAIKFLHSTGIQWLTQYTGRIEVAFVDGKHQGTVVWKEGALLADRQQPGDLVIFDDVHLPDVRAAVASLSAYTVEWMNVLPKRAYAIARRK